MKKGEKKNPYKLVYEPMLNLEIRIYIGEKGKIPYNKYLFEVSGRILRGEAGNTITEPIECDEGGVFRAMRVYDETDYRYFVHEMYHLVNAIKETYDLGEEGGAYLIGWLADKIL